MEQMAGWIVLSSVRCLMRIEFEYRGDVCIMRVHGRFRTGSDGAFAEACQRLTESGTRKVVADLSHVPYLDSTGLAFVVGLHNLLSAQGGWLALASVGERARAILRLTRVDRELLIRDGELRGMAA
jgi:anti-sigma B factor antagonist